jgi:hypothetical protein
MALNSMNTPVPVVGYANAIANAWQSYRKWRPGVTSSPNFDTSNTVLPLRVGMRVLALQARDPVAGIAGSGRPAYPGGFQDNQYRYPAQ